MHLFSPCVAHFPLSTCTSLLNAIPENGKFEQEELRNLYLLQALKEENAVKDVQRLLKSLQFINSVYRDV